MPPLYIYVAYEPLPLPNNYCYCYLVCMKVSFSSNKVVEVRVDEIDVGMTKSKIFFPIT